MKRKLLSVLLTVSLAVTLLTGCSSKPASTTETKAKSTSPETKEATAETKTEETPADTSTGESKDIMFVSIVTGGVAWGAAQKGFEDALAELGWTGQYCSPATANDMSEVVTLLETSVTNNADGILSVVLDSEQVSDVFKRAKEKDIPMITCNTYTTEDMQNCWIGTDPDGMGIAQANAVLDNFKGDNITLAYIQTGLTIPTQNQQFEKMSEVIKEKYPNAVLIQDECDSNAQTASDKCSALKKAYPDLNVIVCADGYGATGVANFIESEGYQDKIVGVGIDDSEQMLDFVANGVMNCTIAQDFYTMGYQGVMMLKQIMDGETLPFANDSGTITITKDNVEDHIALLKERGLID